MRGAGPIAAQVSASHVDAGEYHATHNAVHAKRRSTYSHDRHSVSPCSSATIGKRQILFDKPRK